MSPRIPIMKLFVYKWSTLVCGVLYIVVNMSSRMEYIISPWEAEAYIQNLQISEMEDIGTKGLISYRD